MLRCVKWTFDLFLMMTILFLFITSCSARGEKDAPAIPECPRSKKAVGVEDRAYVGTDWCLKVYVTNKGSRSQGSFGRLYYQGKRVEGKKGEVRELEIGTVRYNGPEEFRAHLWDNTGWVMLEPKVKPEYKEVPGPVIPTPVMKDLDREIDEFTGGQNN